MHKEPLILMKTKCAPIFVAVLSLLLASGGRSNAGEKLNYSATAAHDAVEAACTQAAKESKQVFIKSGFPECGWCRIFDRYHNTPEVQQIIG